MTKLLPKKYAVPKQTGTCNPIDVKRCLEKALNEVMYGTWPEAQEKAEYYIEKALAEIKK